MELALEAAPVIAHELAAILRREGVGEPSFPQFIHKREQKVNRLRDKAVNEKAIVLLGLIEAQLVHVIPAAKDSHLHPTHQFSQWPARVAVEPGDTVETPLVADRREDRLV